MPDVAKTVASASTESLLRIGVTGRLSAILEVSLLISVSLFCSGVETGNFVMHSVERTIQMTFSIGAMVSSVPNRRPATRRANPAPRSHSLDPIWDVRLSAFCRFTPNPCESWASLSVFGVSDGRDVLRFDLARRKELLPAGPNAGRPHRAPHGAAPDHAQSVLLRARSALRKI